MKVRLFLLVLMGMVVFANSNVSAEERAGAFSFSPNFGYFLSDEGKDDSTTYGAGIGYNLTDRVGVEGTYNRIETELENNGREVDGYLGRLDMLVNLSDGQYFVPYFAVGGGNVSLKPEGGKSNSQLLFNWGLGMKYFLTDNLALRADGRQILTSNDDKYLITAGLTFFFGGEKKAKASETKPAPRPEDSDGDGVYDDQDQCPNTPAGIEVDSRGCPVDSDGDGVYDDQDQCPNTPAGMGVDSRGCPVDSDGDGVYDGQDQCPNTPAGMGVDSRGCPVDSDGDGVYDDQDQCPNTPKGATVDSRGCWVLRDLRFATNKADINTEGARILDNVVTIMQADQAIKLEIQGHTDNKGSAAYNKSLSQKRAQAVMDYLVSRGISKDRLNAVGYGFERPAASNDTEEGRAENRRVQLNPVQ